MTFSDLELSFWYKLRYFEAVFCKCSLKVPLLSLLNFSLKFECNVLSQSAIRSQCCVCWFLCLFGPTEIASNFDYAKHHGWPLAIVYFLVNLLDQYQIFIGSYELKFSLVWGVFFFYSSMRID